MVLAEFYGQDVLGYVQTFSQGRAAADGFMISKAPQPGDIYIHRQLTIVTNFFSCTV